MKEKRGKENEKGLTEIVFILDRSGSMNGLESDIIGGFNSVIAKKKKIEAEAIISTVLFDDQFEVFHPLHNLLLNYLNDINHIEIEIKDVTY